MLPKFPAHCLLRINTSNMTLIFIPLNQHYKTIIMGKTIAFESDGEPIVLSLNENEVEVGGLIKIGAETELEKAEKTLSNSLDSIKDVINSLDRKLKESNNYPDEVKVDFGIKVAVETGAIIAKASGEGHINLSLTWKKKS